MCHLLSLLTGETEVTAVSTIYCEKVGWSSKTMLFS